MIRRLASFLRRFDRDDRGVAAIETALVGTVILAGLLNVVEVGRYAYTTMQVNAASQAGAQALIVSCGPSDTPVTENCDDVEGAVETAIAGTSLGDKVELDGALDEGWYCISDDKTLEKVAAASAPKPSNCDDEDMPTGPAALYVKVKVATAFAPIFPGLTIAESFPDEITKTAWMRVQ